MTITDDYNPRLDAKRSYDEAHKALREICIRRKQVLPRPDDPEEMRWAEEGERPLREICMRQNCS